MADVVRTLEKVPAETDALIRVRLKEIGLDAPYLVTAVTPDGEVVLRSNVSPDVLRSFGQDLINVANELEAPPTPGHTTHCSRHRRRTKRWWMAVRKTVDVFLKDKLVASYLVVVEVIDRPTDDDFIAEQMQGHYSSDDIQSARFLVRSVLE